MPEETEITELVDVTAPRVDGVRSAANGIPFLVIKQLDDQTIPPAPETAAAPDGDVVKAKVDCAVCNGKGKIKGGSTDCPECDATGKVTKTVTMPAGKSNCGTCTGTGTVKGSTAPCPDCAGTGLVAKEVDQADPEQPGSAAWEANDAAALRDVAAQLAALKTKIEMAADRERTEAMDPEGDPSDFGNAWDLDDACSALDYTLGIVAAMSFGEAQESSNAAMSAEGVAKAAERRTASREALTKARNTITDLLKEAQPDQEVDVTKDELQSMLTEQVNAAVTKAVDAALANVKPAETAEATAPVVKAGETAETSTETAPEAGDVTKTAAETTTDPVAGDVLKASDITEALAGLPDLIKAAVAPLEERIEKMASQPRPGGPLVNGAANRAIGSDDLAKALDGKTPAERAQIMSQRSLANATVLFGGTQPS